MKRIMLPILLSSCLLGRSLLYGASAAENAQRLNNLETKVNEIYKMIEKQSKQLNTFATKVQALQEAAGIDNAGEEEAGEYEEGDDNV